MAAKNNESATPGFNKKRHINEIISSSEGPQADHANSPYPTRRKEYRSPEVPF
jgi:hypothetical protein